MDFRLDTLRSGAWLTRERMRLVALAVLVASGGSLVYLAATAHGAVDFKGRPLGTDFASFYAAGTLVLQGHALAAFDQALLYAREQALFGPASGYYCWLYPPVFLLPVAALALLPYVPALLLGQAVSFAGYIVAMRALLRAVAPQAAADRLWLLLAAAFPPVLINFGHGQNGLATAALLAGALATLPRRPILAGMLFGLLIYKPQFGLLIPLALIAGGYWRTILAAAVTVALLVAVTSLAFGIDIWPAFMAASHLGRTMLIEQGAAGWSKIQSVFALVRLWGGGIALAYVVQTAVMLSVAAALAWLWRSRADYPLKAAALAIGMLLAAPYSLDYDLMLLAPAIGFLAADGLTRGFAPWQKSLLALLWFVPLIARTVAGTTLIPLAVPAMLLAFAFLLQRATHETGDLRSSGVLQSTL
jgi:alpha-1,2-mannosyltransferase